MFLFKLLIWNCWIYFSRQTIVYSRLFQHWFYIKKKKKYSNNYQFNFNYTLCLGGYLRFTRLALCSFPDNSGTNLAHTPFARSIRPTHNGFWNVRSVGQQPNNTRSTIRVQRITHATLTLSSIWLVDGRPERASSSVNFFARLCNLHVRWSRLSGRLARAIREFRGAALLPSSVRNLIARQKCPVFVAT